MGQTDGQISCIALLHATLPWLVGGHINKCHILMCSVWAPGRNEPLIQFVISVLYILLACLNCMLPCVSFCFTFSLLISSLIYLFL